MPETRGQLAAVIGSSVTTEELRKCLGGSGVTLAGNPTHIRVLRRRMLLSQRETTILVVTLDSATLERYGRSLRDLVADLHTLPGDTYSVGVLASATDQLSPSASAMGCDMYVVGSSEASSLVQLLLEYGHKDLTNAGILTPPGRRWASIPPGVARDWLARRKERPRATRDDPDPPDASH